MAVRTRTILFHMKSGAIVTVIADENDHSPEDAAKLFYDAVDLADTNTLLLNNVIIMAHEIEYIEFCV